MRVAPAYQLINEEKQKRQVGSVSPNPKTGTVHFAYLSFLEILSPSIIRFGKNEEDLFSAGNSRAAWTCWRPRQRLGDVPFNT